MKKILLTAGVAAMVTVTFNSFASDALLSPRAAGNQIAAAAGTSTGAVAACSKMAGNPKAVAECASHPSAPMPCCAVAAK